MNKRSQHMRHLPQWLIDYHWKPLPNGSRQVTGLNVGAGADAIPGWENADRSNGFDATHPWPYGENVFDVILASHILEHLPHDSRKDPVVAFLEEATLALKPGGRLLVRVPAGLKYGLLGSIDHCRAFTRHTFDWLLPSYEGDAFQHLGYQDHGLRLAHSLVIQRRFRLLGLDSHYHGKKYLLRPLIGFGWPFELAYLFKKKASTIQNESPSSPSLVTRLRTLNNKS